MYVMAAHLVFWGKAKIINIMTKNNVYTLASHNDEVNENMHTLWKEFSCIFPDFNLVEVLANFSVPKPLSFHVQTLQHAHHRDFVLVVGWLLQKELLVQLHTYPGTQSDWKHLLFDSTRYVHLLIPKEFAPTEISLSQTQHRFSYPTTLSYPNKNTKKANIFRFDFSNISHCTLPFLSATPTKLRDFIPRKT